MYHSILVSGVQHSGQHLWNDHYNKSSNYQTAYKVIIILLTIFLMLYTTSPWLTYFITRSLYLLAPFAYFTYLPPLTSGNY